MATRTWVGTASDGDWNNTTNWGGSAAPVTGDSVIISRSATYGITTNVNQAGVNIVDFFIEKGYGYDIGSFASPLRLTADKFTDQGNGALYFSSDTGASNFPTDRMIIDKGDISKIVYVGGPTSGGQGNDGVITALEIAQGANVYIGNGTDAVTITTLYLVPRYYATDVSVTGNFNATATTSYMAGGTFVWYGFDGTTFNMYNGSLTFRKSTLPLLNQSGGVVIHSGEASNYAISTYNAFGGYMRSTDTGGAKLISTLNRGPMWDMAYNPRLTVSTTNYIGG